MVCYGIFCSGQLPYRKITNKIMEISLTALEVVLFLLNNFFVLKSKDPVFKMGVYIMCFSLNRSFSKYTSHSEFLTPLEFALFFEKIRYMLLLMLLQQYKVRCSKTANDHSHVSRV